MWYKEKVFVCVKAIFQHTETTNIKILDVPDFRIFTCASEHCLCTLGMSHKHHAWSAIWKVKVCTKAHPRTAVNNASAAWQHKHPMFIPQMIVHCVIVSLDHAYPEAWCREWLRWSSVQWYVKPWARCDDASICPLQAYAPKRLCDWCAWCAWHWEICHSNTTLTPETNIKINWFDGRSIAIRNGVSWCPMCVSQSYRAWKLKTCRCRRAHCGIQTDAYWVTTCRGKYYSVTYITGQIIINGSLFWVCLVAGHNPQATQIASSRHWHFIK